MFRRVEALLYSHQLGPSYGMVQLCIKYNYSCLLTFNTFVKNWRWVLKTPFGRPVVPVGR